uniref:Uncharacterized protein n=1 Tax=Romanomermis culicivorax TaxID=13658 RepID=A0A915JIL1_ROMCU
MTSSGAGLPDDLPDEKSKNRLFSDARCRMNQQSPKLPINALSDLFHPPGSFTSQKLKHFLLPNPENCSMVLTQTAPPPMPLLP